MQQNEFTDRRVYKYDFCDPEINKIIDQISEEMNMEKEQYEKTVKQTKIIVTIAAVLLVILLEYLIFRDGWGVSPVLTIVMILTPLLAGFIGYMGSKLYLLITGEGICMLQRAFHWAMEDKRFYIYEGIIQDILQIEKHWSYIVAGNYLWRVKNGKYSLENLIDKEVKLILTDSYSEDMTYECIYVTS